METLQLETDKLLVEITEMRRRCPEEVRTKFSLDLEDLERTMPGVREYLSPLEVNPQLDERAVEGLVAELEKLRTLNQVHSSSLHSPFTFPLQQSIPTLVAKLERAQTILNDSTKVVEANGSAAIKPLSELLCRQRRIARQHDLACRLLSQD